MSPVPTAMVRRPLRLICTGIACAGSLIRMTSLVSCSTRATWPNTPPASSTACPTNTPSCAPLSTSTRCAKGVEVHVHDVADDEAVRDPGGAVAQRTQPLRFGLQRLVALEPELRHAQLCLESGLVGAQRIAGRDAFAKPVPALERAFDGDLHRVGNDRQQAPNLAQMVVALVDDHQSQGQQRVQNTTKQQPRRSSGSIGITKCDHAPAAACRLLSLRLPPTCALPQLSLPIRRCPVHAPR